MKMKRIELKGKEKDKKQDSKRKTEKISKMQLSIF
jgi:hypothetical protein